MTFEAHGEAFAADVETEFAPVAVRKPLFPAHGDIADPEAAWATRHPDRALAFLFVSPRDCAALDELMAL